MAYFHCLIGGGSSGGGYELTVTCDADFAGTTITCTDGVTTLTQTCPSSSPYEVVFEIPNGGDWTISGVVGGHTVTTGVNIPTTATLEAFVQKTITIYSANEDTITYTDIYGDTRTEVFASGQSSKQITIDVEASGSSIKFTSGVAKDPSNLTAYYSKTVTITDNTTEVYLMPDNTLYWYGNEVVPITSTTYRPSNYGGGTVRAAVITKNTTSMNIAADGSSQGGAIYNNIDFSNTSALKIHAKISTSTDVAGASINIATVSNITQDRYAYTSQVQFTTSYQLISIDTTSINDSRAVGFGVSDTTATMDFLFVE